MASNLFSLVKLPVKNVMMQGLNLERQRDFSHKICSSGGSSGSQNKLPQLILGYIYILKYLQSNFIG